MKNIVSILSILIITISTAKPQSVILTFTGRNQNNGYVQLDHVIIKNLTKDWQEILYWPDTVLTMTYTGIENHVKANDNLPIQLTQNNPNPFDGTTYATLILTKDGDVSVEITDVSGRIVETQNFASLQQGTLELLISLSTAGMYFLTARQNGINTSIKMINRGNGGTDNIAITSNVESQFTASALPKHTDSNKGTTNNPFDIGDQMEYVGYATVNGTELESLHITQVQNTSEFITLHFITLVDGQPCPDAFIMTDIDGNTYHTVQIGNQCWMKENLRTTHFADSTPIALGYTSSSTSSYRYNPHNNADYVTDYGYLYNWPAMMHGETSGSSAGVQGVCPDGWHVPDDAEWIQLTDYLGNQSQYQCNGNNTYIAKALSSTTIWTTSSENCAVGNNPADNNSSGFTAFPAGGLQNQQYSFGNCAYFWSAPQGSNNQVLYRALYHDDATVTRFNGYKEYAFSVRCVKD